MQPRTKRTKDKDDIFILRLALANRKSEKFSCPTRTKITWLVGWDLLINIIVQQPFPALGEDSTLFPFFVPSFLVPSFLVPSFPLKNDGNDPQCVLRPTAPNENEC